VVKEKKYGGWLFLDRGKMRNLRVMTRGGAFGGGNWIGKGGEVWWGIENECRNSAWALFPELNKG
jgi:hypothetical protein